MIGGAVVFPNLSLFKCTYAVRQCNYILGFLSETSPKMRADEALARLRGHTGLLGPLLFADVISTCICACRTTLKSQNVTFYIFPVHSIYLFVCLFIYLLLFIYLFIYHYFHWNVYCKPFSFLCGIL